MNIMIREEYIWIWIYNVLELCENVCFTNIKDVLY